VLRPAVRLATAVLFCVLVSTAGAAGTGVNLLGWGPPGLDGQNSGSAETFESPAPVALPDGTTVIAISGGSQHAVALTSAGDVYVWGSNLLGQLGQDPATTPASSVPVKVAGLPMGIKAIAAGGDSTLAATAGGQVYGWGRNDNGQLGVAVTTESGACPLACRFTPQPVLPNGVTATGTPGSLTIGPEEGLAWTDHGLYGWGWNGASQLCVSSLDTIIPPRSIPVPSDAMQTTLAGGNQYETIATSAGEAIGCGDPSALGLGPGGIAPDWMPALLPQGHAAVKSLSAENNTTFALLEDGSIWAYGQNLGLIRHRGDGSPSETADTPARVLLPGGVQAVTVDAGEETGLAATSAGDLYGWGSGSPLGGLVNVGPATDPVLIPLSGSPFVLDAVTVGVSVGLAVIRTTPAFTAASPPLNATVGVQYTYLFTATGYPAPTFTWAPAAPSVVTPPGLDLGSDGTLTGVPSMAGVYHFTVTASNGTGSSATVPITLTISDPGQPIAPAFFASTPPNARINTAYGGYQFKATGFPVPTFSVTDPTKLPTGMSVAADGTLSGTPSVFGPFEFDVEATNSTGHVSVHVTLGVEAPPVFDQATPTTAHRSHPYSYTFHAVGYPTAMTYTLTGGPLQTGLHFDAATGTISGSAIATSTGNEPTFTITASNGIAPDATTGPLRITVDANSAPILTTTLAPTDFVDGALYTATFLRGGEPSPTITLEQSTTPTHADWLTLDVVGNVITVSGTPPAGTTAFSFTVHGTNGMQPDAAITVDVAKGTLPGLGPIADPYIVEAGTALNLPLVVTGSGSPTLAVKSRGPGAEWITLTGPATLTGMGPWRKTTYAITLTVTNALGSVDVTLHILVADTTPPPTPSLKLGAWTPENGISPANPWLQWRPVPADSGSGLGSPGGEVQRQSLGYRSASTGALGDPNKPWTTLTGVPVYDTTLARGTTACYRVRSVDKAGNKSAWSPTRCTATYLDDRQVKRSKAWDDLANMSGKYFDDTFLRASAKGAVLTISGFHGRRVAVRAQTCPTCGSLTVTIGGTKVGTIS
jgi:alpha-tubulin suppressor-like RCC1 family protein